MHPPYRKISSPANKSLYQEGYIDPAAVIEYPIVVGRNVIIEAGAEIGRDCFFGHNACIRPGVKMGNNSEVRVNGWVAEKAKIGHHTVIYNSANVSAFTVIGNYVYFGVYSITTNADDIVLHRGREFVPNPVIIEDGVRIASRCTMLPGVRIGMNALVGANSLVTKDIGPYEVWYGNPASLKASVDAQDVPEAWKTNGGGL